MTHRLALLGFLAFVLGIGFLIGRSVDAATIYAGFVKPSFAPPAWLFAPAWTVLYIMIAIGGWLVWRREAQSTPMRLWWLQMALNFLWTPVFFSTGNRGLALAIISLLLVTILGFIATAWKRDQLAAFLFIPYALWVAFATLLNRSILALN